jgi:hypothetical protein
MPPRVNASWAFVQYLLLQPASFAIPACQTETDLVLTASYYKSPNDETYGIGACPYLPMEFAVYRVDRPFNVSTSTYARTFTYRRLFTVLCRWASNGTAPWDPPIYGDSVGEDFGGSPRLTFPVPYVDYLTNVTRVNISAPDMVGGNTSCVFLYSAGAQLDDFRGWRNGTLEYTGWVLVMNSPESSLLNDYITEMGDPSCHAVCHARNAPLLSQHSHAAICRQFRPGRRNPPAPAPDNHRAHAR